MVGNFTAGRFVLGRALLASILAMALTGCQNATSDATSATLTVTSPVATKLYGVTDSSTNTVAVPLTFTTNQPTVEYSLNSTSTWTTAASGTNLASLLRDGFNTLTVRAKDSSGNVTKTADTLTFLHWSGMHSEGSYSGYNANWQSATEVTTVISTDTTLATPSSGNGGGAFTLASKYLTLTTQTALSTANGTYADLNWSIVSGTTNPTRLGIWTGVRNLPYYSASDSSWSNYVAVGQMHSDGQSVVAVVAATGSGTYQVAIWDTAASTSTVATSSSVSISDFTPNSTFATTNVYARYAVGLIRDGTSFAAGLVDLDTVTVDSSGNATSAPTIVALATKTGYTPFTGTLNSFILPARNLSSDTTQISGLWTSWY